VNWVHLAQNTTINLLVPGISSKTDALSLYLHYVKPRNKALSLLRGPEQRPLLEKVFSVEEAQCNQRKGMKSCPSRFVRSS